MAISSFDKPAGLPPIDFDLLFRTKIYGDEQNEKVETKYKDLYGQISKIKAVPQDVSRRNSMVTNYLKGLDDWTNKYADNPRQGIKELNSYMRQFNTDFNYGALGDIHRKGIELEERMKMAQEMNKDNKFKGEYDAAIYANILAPLDTYGGQKDLGNGTYNTINWGSLSEYTDLQKAAFETLKGWEKRTSPITFKNGKTIINTGDGFVEADGNLLKNIGKGYMVSGEAEKLSKDELLKYAMMDLATNPVYSKQIKDKTLYNDYVISSSNPDSYVEQFQHDDGTVTSGRYKNVYYPEEGVTLPVKLPMGKDLTEQQLFRMADMAAEKYSDEDLKYSYHRIPKGPKPPKPEKVDKFVNLPTLSEPSTMNSFWKKKQQELDLITQTPHNAQIPYSGGPFAPPSPSQYNLGQGSLDSYGAGYLSLPFKERLQKTKNITNVDYQQAVEWNGGVEPADDAGKIKMMSDYFTKMQEHINKHVVVPADQQGKVNYEKYDKTRKVINNMYTNDPDGGKLDNISAQSKWMMSGDSKVYSAEEIIADLKSKGYDNAKDFKMSYIGGLADDDDTWGSGHKFQLVSPDGKVVAQYSTPDYGDNQATGYQIKATFNRAKSAPGYSIPIPGFEQKNLSVLYTVSGKAKVVDNTGQTVQTSDGQFIESSTGSPDPIGEIYSRFGNALYQGTLIP